MKYDVKFYDKNYILDCVYNKDIDKLKIAIHIHLYYIDMLNIFIQYLSESPIYFDLFISVTSENNKDICIKEINKYKIKKINNLDIKVVENIGRDVAPWIIEFPNIQSNYDLCCHLHTKKSLYNDELSGWGEYLIKNLISKEAIINILSAFYLDKNIGMIFPPIYKNAFCHILTLTEPDKNNLISLLNKLNMDFIPNYDNFIFPAGTMLWYNPKVLKPIFEMGLTYSDFPEEPIPTTGTIAHAIERLIGIICEQTGYKIKCYITRKSLIDNFFDLYGIYEDKKQIQLELNNVKNVQNLENNLLNKKNIDIKMNILSIIEIGKFAILKIEKYDNKFILIIFGIKITIKTKNTY